MPNVEKRGPNERGSTDDSLRSERRKTDHELAKTAEAISHTATDVVAEARDKADTILDKARVREDLNSSSADTAQDRRDVSHARAREDAALQEARSGADVIARDEHEQRRIALARLLAFERSDTDLKLELERVRADAELTSREDFMAIVSHDLRSLIGGIALSAELLKDVERTAEPFAKVKSYVERIQRFSARMNRLVGDLMDVASIEAGNLSLLRSRRDLSLLLRDAQEAFEPAAAAQGIQLTCECSEAAAVLDVDHERILQVLANLVGNALKFTPRGGTIAITADRQDDSIRFAVSDTGEGIEVELLDEIFERHFQSRDPDRRGLGLGLFIAKSIVEAHGGKIWAKSAPGAGSTFYFFLPLRIADLSSTATSPPSS